MNNPAPKLPKKTWFAPEFTILATADIDSGARASAREGTIKSEHPFAPYPAFNEIEFTNPGKSPLVGLDMKADFMS